MVCGTVPLRVVGRFLYIWFGMYWKCATCNESNRTLPWAAKELRHTTAVPRPSDTPSPADLQKPKVLPGTPGDPHPGREGKALPAGPLGVGKPRQRRSCGWRRPAGRAWRWRRGRRPGCGRRTQGHGMAWGTVDPRPVIGEVLCGSGRTSFN